MIVTIRGNHVFLSLRVSVFGHVCLGYHFLTSWHTLVHKVREVKLRFHIPEDRIHLRLLIESFNDTNTVAR